MLSGDVLRMAAGFAVVDVETTGSSSRRHRVVELAVVQLDRERRVQGEFATLIDPEGPVGPTHIHGIEGRDLRSAPRFWQVAERLTALLRGRVLVGHNVGCDRAFLAAEYARIGVRLPAVPQVCTMRLAEALARRRAAVPAGGTVPGAVAAVGGLSLRACAEAAGLPGWAEHTALGDARVTGELFARYAARWPRDPAAGGEAGWLAGRLADGTAGTAAGLAAGNTYGAGWPGAAVDGMDGFEGIEGIDGVPLGRAACWEWPRMPGRARARGAVWVGRTPARGAGCLPLRPLRPGVEARRPIVPATCQGGA